MSREATSQEIERYHIAFTLFVDPADQNYVVARWCFQQGLALDFLWNAAQCLEKFMKGALLLNGRSAICPEGGKGAFGHDLELLYSAMEDVAQDLLPDLLIKPNDIDMRWRVEPAATFMGRISAGGDAHNRYQIFGYDLRREDLYKLDRMVFSIRRICCPLDKHYLLGRAHPDRSAMTHREALAKNADIMPRAAGSRWRSLTDKKARGDLRFAALNHNFLFADADFEHGELRVGGSSHIPVLLRNILRRDQKAVGGEKAAETIELAEWVIANIHLPGSAKKELRDACERLRSRIGPDQVDEGASPPKEEPDA